MKLTGLLGALTLIALLLAFIAWKNAQMSTVWTAPFYSAATNLTFGGDFLINQNEVQDFNELDNDEAELHYKFIAKSPLNHYNHNPIGFAYFAYIASFIFPFIGDQLAVIVLQCIVFLYICFIFINGFQSNSLKIIFWVIFCVNPLVLRFVVMSYYYFWQLIPAALIFYLFLQFRAKWIYPLLIILPFILLTRPTIITFLPLLGYLLFKSPSVSKKAVLIYSAYFLSIYSYCFKSTEKNIWHTIFVGVGAYENPYNISLNDGDGYALYEKKYNEKMQFHPTGNYYKESTIKAYQQLTQDTVIAMINQTPGLFVKNSILNTLQSFSIGYINKANSWVNYTIAFLGLLIAILLLYTKNYLLLIGILLGAAPFSLYYPPIPAYMYGNYLLIFGAITLILDKFLAKYRLWN